MYKHNFHPSILREYDIRGIVGSNLNENTAYISILIGLIGGFLLFPSPDFSKSLLVGVFIPIDLFPSFVTQSLLFLSFVIATFLPLLIIKAKKLHIS